MTERDQTNSVDADGAMRQTQQVVTDIDALIEQSSLGTAGARQLRTRGRYEQPKPTSDAASQLQPRPSDDGTAVRGVKQVLSAEATDEPSNRFARTLAIGQVVAGTITEVTFFGVFVRIGDSVEGLVHLSELSDRRGTLPDLMAVGDEVMVRVIDIDPTRRRASLSMKKVTQRERDQVDAEDHDDHNRAAVETEDTSSAEQVGRPNAWVPPDRSRTVLARSATSIAPRHPAQREARGNVAALSPAFDYDRSSAHSRETATAFVVDAIESTGAATRHDFDIDQIVSTAHAMAEDWDLSALSPDTFWRITSNFPKS